MLSKKSHMTLSVSLLAVACATPSFAADAAAASVPATDQDAASASAKDEKAIGDIVVTARRRDEALQSVPQTINAVSATDIERKGLRSVEDLATAVPGIQIGGQRRGDAQFNIRGQGPGPITTGQHNLASVATYFAEVPSATGGPGAFYDLENVQVLKGPQGTLFGRNTTGGAVLFQPHRALYENSGYAKVSFGNYNLKEFEGVVNIEPVPDQVALRVAGQVSRRDGYTTSVVTGQRLDDRKYEAFRATLRLDPAPGVESSTIVDYRLIDGAGGSEVLAAVSPGAVLGAPISIGALNSAIGAPAGTAIPLRVGGTVSVACLSAALPGCPAGGAFGAYSAAYAGGNYANPALGGFYVIAPTSTLNSALATQQVLGVRKNQTDAIARSKALDWGVTNKTAIDASDNLTLKNIIAFRGTRLNQSQDYDGTPINFVGQFFLTDRPWATGYDQFTEEFQIQGKLPSAHLNYILGAYYEHVTSIDQSVQGNSVGSFSNRASNFKEKSKAVFAHVEWNPLDLIGISAGIRQTWDDRFVSFSSLTATGACNQKNPATGLIQCPLTGAYSGNAPTYDVTLNVKPMEHVLAYVSYRHGYKSGGVNLPTPVAPGPNPLAYLTFGPEKVDSFEAGLKADWNIGVPMRTNFAMFYDKYKNMQIATAVPTVNPDGTAGTPTNVVTNAVQATNKGFEFEATVIPVSSLNLSGFVSYLEASANNSVAGVVTAGRQLSNQPKWTYGLSSAFTLPVAKEAGNMVLSANWSWKSDTFNSNVAANSLIPVNPGYGLLSARFDWKNMFGKGVDLGVFATNLLDKTYVQSAYPIAQVGFNAYAYGEPRMYGASLTVHFGAR